MANASDLLIGKLSGIYAQFIPTRVILFHDQTEAADGNRAEQREGWPADRASRSGTTRAVRDAEERDESPAPFRRRTRQGQRDDAS
jgi:hypothetical protein